MASKPLEKAKAKEVKIAHEQSKPESHTESFVEKAKHFIGMDQPKVAEVQPSEVKVQEAKVNNVSPSGSPLGQVRGKDLKNY